MTTLADARSALFEKARKTSATCPCCDKHVKIYRRKLHTSMVLTLVNLYTRSVADPLAWFDVGQILVDEFREKPCDYGKLVWWGFLEKHGTEVGLYRMTEAGKRFVRGEIRARSHAIEYRSNVLDFDGDLITVSQALGRKFDYGELMATPGGVLLT